MNEQAFQALAERVGPVKVMHIAHLAQNFGQLISAHPGEVIALLARATQEELEAAKTPRQVFHLLMAQHSKYIDELFGEVLGDRSGPEVDLSFVKELADVTGAARSLDQSTTEALADVEQEGSTIDPLYYMPGTNTLQ